MFFDLLPTRSLPLPSLHHRTARRRARCVHAARHLLINCCVMLFSTTMFSHASTVVFCAACSTVLCQPTGGKARLTEGCSFRSTHTSHLAPHLHCTPSKIVRRFLICFSSWFLAEQKESGVSVVTSLVLAVERRMLPLTDALS